jgi:hypothetical protein
MKIPARTLEVRNAHAPPPSCAKPLDASGLRSVLAKRIIAAAAGGERDPKRLKLIAVGAIDA